MSFKHDYKDSELMKSYEQVALKSKMMVPQVKEASKIDYSPTNNFNQDILKLCEALRAKGFIAKAQELELNFLNFKKSAAKDTAESMIEDAHPERPRIGESELGVVENILEQHKKILDVVNKNPNGKIASKDVVSSVKEILTGRKVIVINAQDVSVERRQKEALNLLKNNEKTINDCFTLLNSVKTQVAANNEESYSLKLLEDKLNKIKLNIDNTSQNLNTDYLLSSLKEYADVFKIIKQTMDHHFFGDLIDNDKNKLLTLMWQNLEGAKKNIVNALEIFNGTFDSNISNYDKQLASQQDKIFKDRVQQDLNYKNNVEKLFNDKIAEVYSLKEKIQLSNKINKEDKVGATNFIVKNLLPILNNKKSEYSELNTKDSLELAKQFVEDIDNHKNVKALKTWV